YRKDESDRPGSFRFSLLAVIGDDHEYQIPADIVLHHLFPVRLRQLPSRHQRGIRSKAFLIDKDENALGYFERAAQIDPAYVYGTALQQNIWSYVGRSEYSTGKLLQARNSLEKALSLNKEEDMARLYLGLTLACSGESSAGTKANPRRNE